MAALSAAVIVLSGAILMTASTIPSALSEGSRQKLAGFGYVLGVIGGLAWVVAFLMSLTQLGNNL